MLQRLVTTTGSIKYSNSHNSTSVCLVMYISEVYTTTEGYSDLLRRNLRRLSTNNLSVPHLLVNTVVFVVADKNNCIQIIGIREPNARSHMRGQFRHLTTTTQR
jgi:hypothetical protein